MLATNYEATKILSYYKNNIIPIFEKEIPNYNKIKELEQLITIINFINKNNCAFERISNPGHITTSAFIIDPQCKSLVLTLHKKLELWLQIGGHCDGEKIFA